MSIFTSGLEVRANGSGYDIPQVGTAFTTDETNTDVFGALWGDDVDNGRRFIKGPTAPKASTVWSGTSPYIKVYYPDIGNDSFTKGDILFLVVRGWTAGGGWIEPVVSQSITDTPWQLLHQPYLGSDRPLRARRTRNGIPGNLEESFLAVWYRVIDEEIPSSNTNAQVFFNWANGNRPAYDWYQWYGQIVGYRKSPSIDGRSAFRETTFGHNHYESGDGSYGSTNTAPFTSTIHTTEDPSWMGDYETKTGVAGLNRIFFEDNFSTRWNGTEPAEAEKIKKYNKLAVSIMASANLGISPSGGTYTSTSTTQYRWRKRTGEFGAPSLIIGDSFVSDDDVYGQMTWEEYPGEPEERYKNGPSIGSISADFAEMELSFTLQGYTNHKRYSAAGFCAINGIVKFSLDSLAFPDSTSLTIYKNDIPVIYWTLHETDLDDLDAKGPLLARANGDYEGIINLTGQLGQKDAFIWDDPSGTIAGLSVKQGDYIYFDAVSARNDNESYLSLTMEGFPMNYETIMSTDLRDSGGHRMDVIRMQDFGTTYPIGGITITPADFNMTEIKYMQIQPGTAYAETAEDIAVLASQQTASAYIDAVTGETYWKINVFVPDPETGLPVELAEGAPLEFPEGLSPTIMVLGA
jgi:hypothetical protein